MGKAKQPNKQPDKHLNKNLTKRPNKNQKKTQDLIFTYSALEQKRHEIAAPGKCLLNFLGIFPFVPLFLALFSCFVRKLSDETYKRGMFLFAGIMLIGMITYIVIWIRRMFYVYIIDEKGNLYRLRISNFWYKIRGKMFLLNPAGVGGNRFTRLYYMLCNIKSVLDDITETVSYEELITMGRLERIFDVSEVRITKKKIRFHAKVQGAKGVQEGNVSIGRVYENDRQLTNYLLKKDYKESESVRDILEEIRQERTPLKKIVSFTLTWTCIFAWAAVVFLSRDLNRLSKINAGEFVKTEMEVADGGKTVTKQVYVSVENEETYFLVSEYGKMYRPVLIIYISVEFLYLISKGTDMVISSLKKEDSE